jgi:very-short-patch-repair endonuclease
MRHEPTSPERKLWRWLRNRRFGDHKFRRQYPIGRYVLDFYCHELKLAIELDGSPHQFREDYDDRRTAELRGYGITVVRFTNDDLRVDPDTVAARIEWAISLAVDARPSPGLRPPSPGGRGCD